MTWASDNLAERHALPLAQRCSLLKTLVQAIDNPRLSQVQELPSSPWAITTLRRAEALWPDHHLSFVVGSDLADQILRWKDADQLVRHCRITIVPREGWPRADDAIHQLQSKGAEVELLPLKIPGTASSNARRNHDASQIPAVLEAPCCRSKGSTVSAQRPIPPHAEGSCALLWPDQSPGW